MRYGTAIIQILFDTSVLVAAMVESHPAHLRALPWLQRVRDGDITGIVAAHSLAETYAVLTRLPIQPRISPQLAYHVIQHNILDLCSVVALSSSDYTSIIADLVSKGLIGGVTYDALAIYAAQQANVDQLLTLNAKDFRRIAPELTDQIIEP